jgi:hypothetical protein
MTTTLRPLETEQGTLTLPEPTAKAPSDPKLDRAAKEFRIAEIRMEIAKLNYEKSQLRAELAKP